MTTNPTGNDSAPAGPAAEPKSLDQIVDQYEREMPKAMRSARLRIWGLMDGCEYELVRKSTVASPPAAASAEPFCYALTLDGELCSGENVVALLRDDLQLDSHQEYAAANEKYEAIPLYTHPAPDADSVALLREARTCMHDGYFNRQWHGSLAERIDAALARKP